MNRIVCRLSLRDRNRGGASFGPPRLPDTDAKKFRNAVARSASARRDTTADTVPSHARSGRFFASVMTWRDCSASLTNGNPFSWAWLRIRSASLNTVRAHPNARPSAIRWVGVGSIR